VAAGNGSVARSPLPFADQVAHLLQYSLGGETRVISDLAGDARVVEVTRR